MHESIISSKAKFQWKGGREGGHSHGPSSCGKWSLLFNMFWSQEGDVGNLLFCLFSNLCCPENSSLNNKFQIHQPFSLASFTPMLSKGQQYTMNYLDLVHPQHIISLKDLSYLLHGCSSQSQFPSDIFVTVSLWVYD